MTAHETHYLTCDKCGKVLEEYGVTVYADEPEGVKAEAVDYGWEIGEESDYCNKCKPKQ